MQRLATGVLVFTAASLAAAMAAGATDGAADSGRSHTMALNSIAGDGLARVSLSRNSIALDDPTIVAIFDAANTADIETGELAAKLGSTDEVRKFGTMLSNDHKTVRQLGRDLAKKLGVTPTPPKPDQGAIDHAAAMKRLGALKGAAFDHAFLQHEVAFHAAVLEAINKTLLPATRNAELKALVVKVAPAFQGHMMAASTMDKRMFPNGVSMDAGM